MVFVKVREITTGFTRRGRVKAPTLSNFIKSTEKYAKVLSKAQAPMVRLFRKKLYSMNLT